MKIKAPDALLAAEVSRRGLMKTTAIGGLAMASSAFTLPFTRIAHAADALAPVNETVTWSACTVNCGSRCPLRMHVVDGEIKYVETDNTGDDNYDGLHQVRACLRGRSMRRRVYNPDRLKYPMKRVGKRGEGKFERISWEEAFDTIASNMQRLIKDYGNESIYLNYGTGTLGGTMTRSWPPGKTLIARLMNCCGGYLNHYGDYSSAQIAAGLNYTYGGWADGNSPSDIENSQLVVLFGNNPGETRMSGGGVTYYLEQARQKSNARMIIVDPRYTDTGAGREDEWIPIRPGTDAALVSALAWVMITENLVDQPFLDKYCVGYDEKTLPADAPANGHYKAYILGQGSDGTAKTPQWASTITGIPVERIVQLAVVKKLPAGLRSLWLVATMVLGILFVWMMVRVYNTIDTVPTWYTVWTPLSFFLTLFLGGPLLGYLLLRVAGVDGWAMRLLPVVTLLALVASVIVALMQGSELPMIHSSIQQASALVPDYGSLMAWRVVALVLALACWVVPLLKGYQPAVPLLSLALVLVLVGEMVGRGIFYGLHMTVGMAIAS
ncbi:MAG: DmsC/YnfH family molybdoenzyme membrane anchor subunit [Raoultella ornithinolytica]